MADLVTRLLLNSSQFDNNIRNSTQQVQQFQNTARTITSMIGKFAGALGVAYTAGEAFNKWVHSSQELGDNWDNTVNACKGTVDLFFQSLSNGDWSAFQDGLFSTVKGLRELSALRDSLADAKLTMDFNSKRFEAQFSELEAIIRDKTKSLAERKKAFEQLQTLKADFKLDITDTAKGNDATLLKSLQTQYKGHNWTTDDIEKYLSVYNNDFSSRKEKAALDSYKNKLTELQGKQYSYSYNKVGDGIIRVKNENYEITRQIALLKEQNEQLEKMRILNNDDDKDRQQMLKDYEYSYDLKKRAADFDKRTLELQNSLASATKSNQKVNIPEKSLADLDKQINAKKAKLNLAINDADRVKINQELEELTEKKRIIEFQYKYPNAPVGNLDEKGAGLGFATKNSKLPDKISPVIKNTDVKNINDYATGLQSVATVLGAVNSLTNDGIAGWLQWGAAVMTSVATAIPAIQTLITAKTAEAGTSAVASAAQTPVVGWLLAGAAVASVLAALASLPKFAEGGIFAGNSTIGDMNLARVNAGEMILNNRQQKNLFNLLDRGTVSSAASGEVTFKVEGKALVGVLNNYTNRQNKVR